MNLGPRQRKWRKTCYGTEIILRVNIDSAWLIIHARGRESFYRDIAQRELDDVVTRFEAIHDQASFDAFIRSVQQDELTSSFSYSDSGGHTPE